MPSSHSASQEAGAGLPPKVTVTPVLLTRDSSLCQGWRQPWPTFLPSGGIIYIQDSNACPRSSLPRWLLPGGPLHLKVAQGRAPRVQCRSLLLSLKTRPKFYFNPQVAEEQTGTGLS